MRAYSKVSPQFWIGATGKKLRKAGVEAQLIALYLMTCSHSNMLGLYYLPKMYIAHECGLTLEGACKGLDSAIEAGFCSYDDDSEMVWVHEMAIYQIGEQLSGKDKRIQGVQNEYDSLPECPFLLGFFNKYRDVFVIETPRGIKAPSKPLASQEQEQEQEQKAGTGTGTGTGTGLVPARQADAVAEVVDSGFQKICKSTWLAYGTAYFNRYGTEPVRNAKVNTMVKQFVQRIGGEEAPPVAAHFVQSNAAYYVQRGHVFDCLLKDAEKLRTEWATGRRMTSTRARQIDQTQSNASAVDEALELIQGGDHAKAA